MNVEGFLAGGPCVEVRVEATAGSVPRAAGTWMLVASEALFGTIGGGVVEHRAIAAAREMLADGRQSDRLDVTLGPDNGQCCGGAMQLALARVDLAAAQRLSAAHRPRTVYVFGAGHVGTALAEILKAMPVLLRIIDERPDFAGETIAAPEAVIKEAPKGSVFVVTTHAHATDFLVAAEALKRADAAYIGMIGSATKRARFESWLKKHEPDVSAEALICPMGASGKGDKRPQVIALHVAAEIMAVCP